MTAYAQPHDREKALAAGFQVHFAKPLDLGIFIATITSLKPTLQH